MPKALWLLIGLQSKGWLRKVGRSLRTVHGALLALFGLLILVPWFLSVILTSQEASGVSPDAIRRYGPPGLIAYCLLIALISSGERALYFSPGEVNFLFPAPFTRRQLLIYKIAISMFLGLLTSLFFTVFFGRYAQWFVAAYLGLFLTFLFLQLTSMLINFMALSIGTRAYSRMRKIAMALIIVGVGAILLRSGALAGGVRGLTVQLEQSGLWRAVTAPLQCLVETFLTAKGEWLALLKYAGLSVLVNGVMVCLVLLMDAHYLEAAASTSERIYAQLQRARRGEVSWSPKKSSGKPRLRAPMLPYWGGVGPIAWHQMTTALRSLSRLVILGIIFIPLLSTMMATRRADGSGMGSLVVFNLLLFMTLFLSGLLPFDFRGDLDRMELLKTLPIPNWRIVVGQLMVPVLIVSFFHIVFLLIYSFVEPRTDPRLYSLMLLIVPLNFLMFSLDNLVFLFFPSKVMIANPGDIQAMGRTTLLVLLKTLVLLVVVGLAGLLGAFVYFVTGRAWLPAVVTATVMVSLAGISLIPLLSWAFAKFDVARNRPES